MWGLQLLKYAFNNSFDYFIGKVRGRFAAFVIQLVLSNIAITVFSIIATLIAVALINNGPLSLDVFSTEGIFQFAGMLESIWVVSSVICVNYFFRNPNVQRMTFVDLYKGKSSGFWLDLSIALFLLAVVFIAYNRSVLFNSYADNITPLNLLMNEGMENTGYSIQSIIGSWIYYIVHSLPVVAIILIEVRERRRNGITLKSNIVRVILIAILMYFVITWTAESFLQIFQELILNVLNSPFEMVEIPIFFGITSTIFFQAFRLMFISVFVHFLIAYAQEESQPILRRNETSDLLDN